MSQAIGRPHYRIFASFFLYALMMGAMFPRLGDIQLRMGVGEAALGFGLIGSAIGTQVTLALGGGLIERFGYKRIMLVTIPIMGIGFTLTTLAPNAVVFFFCMFLAGLNIGLIETIVNVEADRIEHQIGKRIMSRAHSFWSFGFMAAALVGAVMGRAAVDPTVHLLLVLGVVTVANTWLFMAFVPAPKRQQNEAKAPAFVAPTRPILVLVAFTISAMVLEGASLDWTVIYMRDVHGTGPGINSLALAVFTGVMAVARFYADGFLNRYGPERVARLLVIAMGIGAILVAAAPNPWVALLGYVFLGVGTSAIFPIGMSAAAQMTDRPSAVNVASMAQLSFVNFLLAPPLLGFVAEHFGIRVSYAVGLPLVVMAWFALNAIHMKRAPAEVEAEAR